MVFSYFLESCLPKLVSKVKVLAETCMKKSKKRRAIAPAVLGGCGGLDRLLESLLELFGPKKIKSAISGDEKAPAGTCMETPNF